MTDILLSICIPTYNRPVELAECLQSLADIVATCSDLPPFEIVISDNASPKDIEGAIAPFRDSLPIRYYRNPDNIGPARNLILGAERGTGEYLWFLADDDALKTSDLPGLFAALATKRSSMYFVPRLICDKNLHELDLPPQPAIGKQDIHFADGKEMFDQMPTEIGTVLGFFSSVIIRATDWHEALRQNRENFSEWHHMTTILAAIVDKPVTILAEPFILCRTNNYRSFKVNSEVWLDDYVRVFLYGATLGYGREAMAKNINQILDRQQKTYLKDMAIGKRHQSLKALISELLGGTPFEAIPIHKTKWYYLSFAPLWALRLAFRVATLGRQFD